MKVGIEKKTSSGFTIFNNQTQMLQFDLLDGPFLLFYTICLKMAFRVKEHLKWRFFFSNVITKTLDPA